MNNSSAFEKENSKMFQNKENFRAIALWSVLCYNLSINNYLGENMNSIIESVNSSRRLKIFMTYCVMTYLTFGLLLSLIKTYVPFFAGGLGALIYALLSLFVKAPLVYGMVRGIATKNYNFSTVLGAFGEVKNYGIYGAYVVINIAYEVIYVLIEKLAMGSDVIATVGSILSIIFIVVRLWVNFFLVTLYFEGIDKEGRPLLVESLKKTSKALGRVPLKVLGAEMLLFVSNFLSLYISSLFVSVLPSHSVVTLIFTSLHEILFGAVIIIWPVYYLYYKQIVLEE